MRPAGLSLAAPASLDLVPVHHPPVDSCRPRRVHFRVALVKFRVALVMFRVAFAKHVLQPAGQCVDITAAILEDPAAIVFDTDCPDELMPGIYSYGFEIFESRDLRVLRRLRLQ